MRSAFLVIGLGLAGTASADGGALARSFALPELGQHQAVAPGKTRITLELDLSNEFVAITTPTESIRLDGETLRLGFTYHGGFTQGWDWNFAVPVYVLGGGFMDRFIQGWHDVFGLPNGGREFAADDQYEFRYERPVGTPLLLARESGAFFGDMTAGIGWQALPQLALRAQAKLPTGDGRKLTGGNTGGAFWADAALPFAENSAWSGYASAGVSFNERGEVLTAQQEQTVWFGGSGLRYQFTSAFGAYADVQFRSALYSGSDLEPLSGIGAPAQFGVSYQMSPTHTLDLAFQEDLNPSASPDFGLRLRLRTH